MLADLKVAPDHERMRLDVFVSSALGAEYTRSQVARMIKAGLVTVNGAPSSRPSSAVHQGDSVADRGAAADGAARGFAVRAIYRCALCR